MICRAETPQQKAGLLAYIARRVGETPQDLVGDMKHEVIGVLKDGKLVGAIVFLNYRRQSIEFHLAGSPGWMTRGEIRQLFSYVFHQIGCLRLWCIIQRNNKPSRRGAERLGFKPKTPMEDEFGPGKDGILYSMRRCECKWLK